MKFLIAGCILFSAYIAKAESSVELRTNDLLQQVVSAALKHANSSFLDGNSIQEKVVSITLDSSESSVNADYESVGIWNVTTIQFPTHPVTCHYQYVSKPNGDSEAAGFSMVQLGSDTGTGCK